MDWCKVWKWKNHRLTSGSKTLTLCHAPLMSTSLLRIKLKRPRRHLTESRYYQGQTLWEWNFTREPTNSWEAWWGYLEMSSFKTRTSECFSLKVCIDRLHAKSFKKFVRNLDSLRHSHSRPKLSIKRLCREVWPSYNSKKNQPPLRLWKSFLSTCL